MNKLVALASFALLAGCTAGAHDPAQSWDQEHLKANDTGCPTAIYSAPNGNLQLCEPGAMINGMDVTPVPKPEPAVDESGSGPQERA